MEGSKEEGRKEGAADKRLCNFRLKIEVSEAIFGLRLSFSLRVRSPLIFEQLLPLFSLKSEICDLMLSL